MRPLTGWASIPRELRSVVRARLNSEQPADKEQALKDCADYGLDYDTERARILSEMIEAGRALMERQTSGESKAEKFKP